jgi:hypothetical protein
MSSDRTDLAGPECRPVLLQHGESGETLRGLAARAVERGSYPVWRAALIRPQHLPVR